MAKNGFKFDIEEVVANLNKLSGPLKESLARRSAVAGGEVLRDEAKRWVPKSVGPYNPKSRGSQDAETLRNAIYLAFDKKTSTQTFFQYNVSWNAKKAWWGKLVEFGYYRRYRVYFNDKKGVYVTIKVDPLRNPVWVAPKPFLGAADNVAGARALQEMIDTAREQLPILLEQAK